MNKRTREIVALVLLALLGLVVLAAMAWYIFIGHNWNRAATNIDETVGQMDGYTVVLFEGQMLPASERDRISDEQPLLDDENRGLHERKAVASSEEDQVSISEAASYYRQKGATVFILHLEASDTYDTPLVLNKNGCWLGIFHADGATSRLSAQVKAAELKTRGVDFVVMIVDDVRMIANPISSADILICTSDEGLSSTGEYHENSFCIETPFVGQVQTIIISPSRVLTTKAITWL